MALSPARVAVLFAIVALATFGFLQLPVGPQKDAGPVAFHVVFRHYGVGA